MHSFSVISPHTLSHSLLLTPCTRPHTGKLLDAGMNILRMNFSHGDQKGHLEVLERFRKVRVCEC